jgi:antitoxin (DNA-binding transcriptional repressor) of toxin-antitoxin stability system
MKKARIGELKNHLSRYLDHVRGGGSVLVLDGDQPVVQIVPLPATGRDVPARDGRLARLERRGLIRRGAGGLPSWLGRKAVKVRGGLLEDILEERRSGW